MKYMILIAFSAAIMWAGFVNPSDKKYNVTALESTDIIYPDEHKAVAQTVISLLDALESEYERTFGFELDDRLSLILASSNNQIANAFSASILNNIALFYGGGATEADYFASKSWIKTLMIHELAHTYQTSAKDSKVSKALNTLFGSNYLPIFPGLPIPLFTYPNALLPTFVTEGDSVLNESRFGNGGRLYSGRTKALLYSLLKDGKLNAARLKNDHIDFPYTEEKYIVGGYFFLYLGLRFGIDRVNGFFKTHSRHYINPLWFSHSFVEQFGSSYERLFFDFSRYFYDEAKSHRRLEGDVIASSKSFVRMNRDDKSIFFMTSDIKTRPVIHTLDKKSGALDAKEGAWSEGKPFLINQRLYTASSMQTSPATTESGLIDEEMEMLPGSESRHVMDIRGKDIIYFDINSSFDEPQLYKNGAFFSVANSEAIFDRNGSVYYFRQEGKKRSLYKDKRALFRMDGYWAKIADIIGDKIYFIASSRYGSTLFCFDGKVVKRVSSADNIIDAKMIDNESMLAETLNSDGYEYMIAKTQESDETPFDLKYPFESEKSVDFFSFGIKKAENEKEYGEIDSMQYTMLYPFFSYASDGNSYLSLSGVFSDPFLYNEVSFSFIKDTNITVAGLGYANSRYMLEYGFGGYRVDDEGAAKGSRDYGAYGYVKLPLQKKGREESYLRLYGYMDSDIDDRNPLILSGHYTMSERYGLSFDYNRLCDLALYAKNDRDDNLYGGWGAFGRDMPYESFAKAGAKYTKSQESGVKLSTPLNIGEDITDFKLLGLDYEYHANSIGKIFFEVEKVININKYFMVFPVSLRRASVSLRHDDVLVEDKGFEKLNIQENVAAINFELLLIHKLPFPVSLKYVENSESIDESKVFFDIGMEF